MAKQTLHVTSPDNFHATVAQALATNDPVFVTFISNVGADGQLWCPDCRTSEPIFAKVFDSLPNYCLVQCSIPRDGYKGNPDHPYRLDKQILLKSIPSLVAWKNDSQVMLRPEDDCTVLEKVSAFVNANL
ncbi:hypothetical protein SAMD00019534_056110 [Acytostelium subglobosum LB1]|uniref:hypothetical protein n=1 Tax=Acytostelium subglobosum LB1 TaxID=1410327 RepID=UPI000644913E|nr:hypothetical protein SAMD00019534_056110 [Acytostelium subglobosum LB1]GAM22436.1 hypothetical protein SAMD00019534_056110 [Acytostelium subglobosum LB1]|eukprot:XP_012754556.1 hypothetical protein SAMD00019534_056110 [Acytostelium subglobosum LB1]